MPTPDRPIGRPADYPTPPGTISRFKIGNQICQGTGVQVQRYRTLGGTEIVQLELLDAILIDDGTDT